MSTPSRSRGCTIPAWRGRGLSLDGCDSHWYGMFVDHDRLVVLVSMNSDVSDSWEREGDDPRYFETFSAKGYALGVNVAVWVMTH